MKRFFVLLFALLLISMLASCSTSKALLNENGISDGSDSFSAGNIAFVIPEDASFDISSKNVGKGKTVTNCSLMSGDAEISITSIDVSTLEEAEIINTVFEEDQRKEKAAAKHEACGDSSLLIIGEFVDFKIFHEEAKNDSVFHYYATFTDSYYVYSVEMALRGALNGDAILFTGEMLAGSSYVGETMRFDCF